MWRTCWEFEYVNKIPHVSQLVTRSPAILLNIADYVFEWQKDVVCSKVNLSCIFFRHHHFLSLYYWTGDENVIFMTSNVTLFGPTGDWKYCLNSHFSSFTLLRNNADLLFVIDRWLKHHQAIVQLSLRAVSETAQLKEERVYAQFMSTDKVSPI